MTTLKEALDQLAKGHELDNEQKKLIIDKWQKELGILPCEDAISRESVMLRIREFIGNPTYTELMMVNDIKSLPPVQPKYSTDEWCHDCSEYDQDKHCCPRYNKVIRVAVEEIKQTKTGHCKDCKYFEYDSVAKVNGIPIIIAHEICSRWGDGCKTKEDGYCFLFEPQESEDKE